MKLKFLYHIPSLNTLSAARTYLSGYNNAILDMGHEFRTLTSDDNTGEVLQNYQPDIFMTSLSSYILKYLNIKLLKNQKKKGMKVFVNTPFWNSPFSKLRLNEGTSISENPDFISLIKSGDFGDYYYNVCEQGDPRMEGFETVCGYKSHTILLAADKTLPEPAFSSEYSSDICFIGTYLPGRRDFMKQNLFPLLKKYNVKLFCQDLTLADRSLNFVMKIGQYFNIPYLKSFKKNNITFEQERSLLRSATISVNIHENYQKKFGDFNDRTFKIPSLGGFEITDNVSTIRKYLKDDKEIVIAKDSKDWFEKIAYYLKYPNKRYPIIKAGREKVLKEHTYHNRTQQIIKMYSTIDR